MYTGKITFIQGELQGSSIDLQPGKQQVLGRNGANCNIFFQSDRVSRVHCAITFDENTGRLSLLNYSTSGTTVNGNELGPQQTVNIDNGAKVKLGHSDNVFTFSAQLVNTNVSTPKRTGVIKRLSKKYTPRPDNGASIFEDYLVEDDEKEVLTLSNDRVLNFFTGKGLLKNKAVLTNRRLYINEHKGIISYAYSRDVVELDEVTGTSIVKRNPIWSLVMAGGWLVVGIISMSITGVAATFLPFLALTLIQAYTYLKLWGNWFVVHFPGGKYTFSIKNISLYEVAEFQRAICALKRKELKYSDM